jgi:hypothetical protein
MAEQAWHISGEYIESCNCDYLCPCIYTNPQGEATDEHCVSLQAYRIDQGQRAEVDLSGLSFALVIRSGRIMSDGGWVFAGVIDERADAAQRAALGPIVAGEAGGIPARIRDNLVSDYRGQQFRAIKFVKDGLRHEFEIPGVLSYAIEGVASRNGNGEPFYLDNTAHPANTRLALARSSHLRIDGFGLELNMSGQGNNGHFAPFSWSS